MRIPQTQLAIRTTQDPAGDKTFALKIATWILLGVTVLMFLSRVAINLARMRKLGLDDVFILLATVFAIGLSVTSLILASEGLGAPKPLTLARADTLQKAYYASQFLFIASIYCSKLCLVAFFLSILVHQVQRRIVRGLGLFILAWSFASLVSVAFQCGFPRPWEVMTLHCYNSGLFWIVYCIIDMTTDVAIIMLSVNLVAYLKVQFSRKATVVACFATRILVIGASLARLIYLYPITPHNNPAFRLWVPVIVTQIQVCLSISTACIPSVKPFFDIWRMDDTRGKGAGSESRLLKRHQRGKSSHSMNSTAAMSLKLGRTADISPRIPSPAPLSPLTPPRYNTPPISRSPSGRSPSDRGLRLQIPPPTASMSANLSSPQTASSFALSPQCLSPNPLLSPSKVSPATGPSPSQLAHSSRLPVSSSQYGSPDLDSRYLSPTTSPQTKNSPKSPVVRYSLTPQVRPTPSVLIPRVVKHRQPGLSQHNSVNTFASWQPQVRYPQRISSRVPPAARAQQSQTPFSATSTSSVASPTVTIPSYYNKTPPIIQRSDTQQSIPSYTRTSPVDSTEVTVMPTISSETTPSSPQRVRNQRILSPQNSSRTERMSPISPASPPRTPLTFWREESSSATTSARTETPFSAMRPNRPWETEEMPVIKDKRNSPRVVVHPS